MPVTGLGDGFALGVVKLPALDVEVPNLGERDIQFELFQGMLFGGALKSSAARWDGLCRLILPNLFPTESRVGETNWLA
jgi:hypothetical protein